MRSFITSSLVALALSTTCAVAQTSEYVVKESKTSAAEYFISNYGIFGLNVATAQAGLTFPRGSNQQYLFGSGIWFGAVKNVRDTARTLVFVTYNPNTGSSWAKPGNGADAHNDAHLYYSGDYDKSTGLSTSTSSTPVWPLWLLRGTDPLTWYPGTFEPDVAMRAVGDKYSGPAFIRGVDEQFVSQYNDQDLSLYEGFGDEFGFPLGLQITQNTYSWSFGRFGSAIVLQYEVVNTSNNVLLDCALGQISDPDIGSSNNDRSGPFQGIDGKVRAGVTYTEAESDGASYGALAQILLESPSTGTDGFIDNTRRRELSRAHEIATFRSWELQEDPATNPERYEYLTVPVLKFDEAPGDKRTVVAGKKFSMRPGDTAYYTIAFGIVDSPFGRAHDKKDRGALQSAGEPSATNLDQLIESLLDDYEKGYYDSFNTSSADERSESRGALSVRPNPATHTAMIEFPIATSASVTISVLNTMGERVSVKALGEYASGTHRTAIDIANLASGTYLIVVDAGAARHTTTLVVAH